MNIATPIETKDASAVSTTAEGKQAAPYTVHPYSVQHVPNLLPLLQTTLGNSGAVRKTADFWQWKHEANPFGPSYGLIAWDEAAGQAAGLRVLMRWRFGVPEGSRYHAVRAVDTATHPAYQRMGIFTRLTQQAIDELAAQGVDCIFNTPNSKSLPGYLKMGWQIAAQWPLYLKPLRPLRMAWRQVQRRFASSTAIATEQFGPSILPWADFTERYGEQAATLLATWEATRPHVGCRTERSFAYLQWRYGGHPHIAYGVLPLLNPAGRLTAFAIVRANVRFGWQEAVLAEVVLADANPATGQTLIHMLSSHLQSDYIIAHAAPDTAELALWRHSGFWRAPRQSITFAVRPLQPDATALAMESAWDLSLGDLEIF